MIKLHKNTILPILHQHNPRTLKVLLQLLAQQICVTAARLLLRVWILLIRFYINTITLPPLHQHNLKILLELLAQQICASVANHPLRVLGHHAKTNHDGILLVGLYTNTTTLLLHEHNPRDLRVPPLLKPRTSARPNLKQLSHVRLQIDTWTLRKPLSPIRQNRTQTLSTFLSSTTTINTNPRQILFLRLQTDFLLLHHLLSTKIDRVQLLLIRRQRDICPPLQSRFLQPLNTHQLPSHQDSFRPT